MWFMHKIRGLASILYRRYYLHVSYAFSWRGVDAHRGVCQKGSKREYLVHPGLTLTLALILKFFNNTAHYT
jgi:hypothetical protein